MSDGPKIKLKDKPGVGNWLEDKDGMDAHMRSTAEHIKGDNPEWTDGRCIATAKNSLQHTCATSDDPVKKARACKSVANWNRAKAEAKADNAIHASQDRPTGVFIEGQLYLSADMEFAESFVRNEPAFDVGAYTLHLAAERTKRDGGLLGYGSTNRAAVEQVQTRLAQLGYEVDADGKWGDKTEEAIRTYQAEHGLKVDGMLGKKTLGSLQRSKGRSTARRGSADISMGAVQAVVTPGAAKALNRDRKAAYEKSKRRIQRDRERDSKKFSKTNRAAESKIARTQAQAKAQQRQAKRDAAIDPETGKPIATAATGPIGSTAPPGAPAFDKGSQNNNPEFNCLPVRAEAITPRGFAKVEDLRVDDWILSRDPGTGRVVWAQIEEINRYEDAPLVALDSGRFRFTSTPNHRWILQEKLVFDAGEPVPIGVCQCGCGKETKIAERTNKRAGQEKGVPLRYVNGHSARGVAPPNKRSVVDEAWAIRPHDKIRLASDLPASNGSSGISDRDAEILGWLAGDGYTSTFFTRGYGPYPRAVITQAKLEMVEYLDEVLTDQISSKSWQPGTTLPDGVTPVKEGAGVFCWTLRQSFIRPIFATLGVEGKPDFARIPAQLSQSGREAMMRGMLLSDGTKRGDGFRFYQNPGPILDTFLMLCALTAQPIGRMYSDNRTVNQRVPSRMSRFASGFEVSPAGRGEVWCPTVSTGEWFARLDNQLFLTGNSKHPRQGGKFTKKNGSDAQS